MDSITQTYLNRLVKWHKFDDLMTEAIIEGRDYSKFQKLREALTPKLREAEVQRDQVGKMWADHARRELAREDSD